MDTAPKFKVGDKVSYKNESGIVIEWFYLHGSHGKYIYKTTLGSYAYLEDDLRLEIKDTYYPDVSELCPGATIIWNGKNRSLVWLNDELLKDYHAGNVRIKYLDQEDVESLGWEKTLNRDKEFGCIESYWHDAGNALLGVYPDRKIRISGGVNQPRFFFFHGTIKNKSELARIMEMIGIEPVQTGITTSGSG